MEADYAVASLNLVVVLRNEPFDCSLNSISVYGFQTRAEASDFADLASEYLENDYRGKVRLVDEWTLDDPAEAGLEVAAALMGKRSRRHGPTAIQPKVQRSEGPSGKREERKEIVTIPVLLTLIWLRLFGPTRKDGPA